MPSPDPKPPHAGPLSGDDAAPGPIGPERLRALREAILNGTYPMDAAVVSGLTTLFRHGAPAAAAGPLPPHPPGSAH